jgi:hypothetical protein
VLTKMVLQTQRNDPFTSLAPNLVENGGIYIVVCSMQMIWYCASNMNLIKSLT